MWNERFQKFLYFLERTYPMTAYILITVITGFTLIGVFQLARYVAGG